MVIQGRALSNGTVLPACPYGGCGGTCPYCERALTNRRLAALTAASTPRNQLAGFGAFGARSYTTPQRDCPVDAYDGKPTGWQDWCDCMFGAGTPENKKCRKRPCANPFDPDPDCVFAGGGNAALAFAPWTDPGAGVRGIQKEGGGLLYLFGGGFRPIEFYELEPDYLFSLTINDPLRAAYIIGHAQEALMRARQAGYPFALPEQVIQTMYGLLNLNAVAAIQGQNVPLVGGLFTATSALVLFGSAGTTVWPNILPFAIPYTFAKDPTGERADKLIFSPVVSILGDTLALVSGIAGSMGGDPAAMAGVVRVLCRRAARMLPATGAADVEIARGLLNAAADSADVIAKIIRDPQAAFTSTGTYAVMGGALINIGKVVGKSGPQNKGLADALFFIGDTMAKLDPSLTMVAQAIANGDPLLLCCGKDTAFDLLPINYLGIKISTLTDIASSVAAAGKATSNELIGYATGSENAKKGVEGLDQAFASIVKFAAELDKALKGIGAAGKFFSEVVKKITEQKGEFDKFVAASQAPDAAVALAATGAALKRVPRAEMIPFRQSFAIPDALLARMVPALKPVATPAPSTRPQGSVVNTIPLDRIRGGLPRVSVMPTRTAPKPSGGAGVLIAGAGAGFLVGGPVGAAVGAGAALLIGGSK